MFLKLKTNLTKFWKYVYKILQTSNKLFNNFNKKYALV